MKNHYSLSGLLLVAFLAIFPLTFYGQSADEQKKEEPKATASFSPYWYLTGDIGAAWHHGDLAQYGFSPDFSYTKINGRIGGGYQFGSIIGLNGKLGRGYLGGRKDGLNAEIDYNDYFEGTLNMTFNVWNLVFGYNPDALFTFAPHIGVGQIQWKVRTIDYTTKALIAQYGYKDVTGSNNGNGIAKRKVALTLPIGADLNFRVNDKWDIYGDYTFSFVDSDVLDGQANGLYKGDKPVKGDMYAIFNVGARYKFVSSNIKNMGKDFGLVTLQVIPEVLEEKGDSVEVTIKGTFPPKYFDKKAVMNFTPVIVYEGGSTALKPITFKGESVTGDGTLISWANGGSFTYTDKVPYNPNMNVSELVVEPVIYAYKGTMYPDAAAIKASDKFYTGDQRKLADGVIYTSKRIKDTHSGTAVAEHQYEKVTIFTQTANLYFQVNMSDLNVNLPLNKNEENKTKLKNITTDVEKGWVIKDVTIAGWASPEGEETFNQGLSGNRSKTAQKMMTKVFTGLAKGKDTKVAYKKAEEINFVLSGNGPDWNGFMNAVEASNIKDKNAILNVVRSADVAQREQEIRNMILIYPEIEQLILPPLRRSIITVNTFEPKRTDEEIATLSTTKPEDLCIKELLYAATLTNDLKTQKMIYASAMRLYPDSWRAFANAGTVEMKLGNYAEAKSLLEKAHALNENSYEVCNNLGVVAAYNKDYAKAEKHFARAQQLGGDVNYNMGIVNIYKGNYSQAVNLMRGKKCDYNLGLAQLLNKDYSGAKSTLDCATLEADAHYLKAVIGARTDDKAMIYENLMKAIQKDENFKNQARWDREFMKYFNEPDFQNIVK